MRYDQPYIQLLFLLKGTQLHCSFNDCFFTLREGDYAVYLVLPAAAPALRWEGDLPPETEVIDIPLDRYFQRFSSREDLLAGKIITGRIQQPLTQIAHYLAAGSPVAERKYFKPLQAGVMNKMYTLRNFLLQHVGESYTLRDLARYLISNETFIKYNFKLTFGVSVFQYLHSIRMQRAQQLLLSSGATISEVAETVGFSHATHFTAAFKKYFGTLPRESRKKSQ